MLSLEVQNFLNVFGCQNLHNNVCAVPAQSFFFVFILCILLLEIKRKCRMIDTLNFIKRFEDELICFFSFRSSSLDFV